MTPDALRSPALPVPHGFFTRQGGVSTGPFASLNGSLSGGDERAHVMENRARVAGSLGVRADALMGLHQVHGATVVAVDAEADHWLPGEGPRADAMVTAQPGLALAIVTADCAPVLFADPGAGVVGAAHAGWRGATAGVLENTVDAMRKLGARADRIVAAIGPCIRQASYEVGDDVRAAATDALSEGARFFERAERAGYWQFDLAGLCAFRLRAIGLTVDVIAADTLPDAARFFSHRRRTRAALADGGPAGPIGHQISAIAP